VTGVIAVTNQQFPWTHGAEKASPFKKVAAFTTNFVAEKPILTPFPEDKFGILGTHQNAIIAYALSVDALEGSVIKCEKRNKEIVLKKQNQSFAAFLAGFDCCSLWMFSGASF
jgi:hypothetical protein